MIAIKCLREGGRSVHSFKDVNGNTDWSLPKDGQPGEWKGPVEGELRPHHNGLHLAKADSLIDWLTGHHYLAETRGEIAQGFDCVVAREARLLEKLPINEDILFRLCESELRLLPRILEALDVYPRITKDIEACVDIIHQAGMKNCAPALKQFQHFRFVELNSIRLNYDELHSIEYNHCTKASKTCLETVVGVFNLASGKASAVDMVKVISNKVARAIESLYLNYLFMEGLCAQGYDHHAEVRAMKKFLERHDLLPEDEKNASQNAAFIFSTTRKRQNAAVLPALGL